MNRTDILKKCVERGVAGQGEIESVSHLFYVYLLSALQRGQRVEVPRFGTFGTRVAGVRKVRKIPYFEPEQELARKVNERFENFKYLVTGRYDPVPVAPGTEYAGREVPYDTVPDQQGKERIIDPYADLSVSEYQNLAGSRIQSSQEEERIMPRLNLRDEGGSDLEQTPYEPEPHRVAPPPTLREVEPSGGSRVTPFIVGIVVLLLLAVGVYALNYFDVVHLWGKKQPRIIQSEAFPEQAAPVESTGVGVPQTPGGETTPTPGALPGTKQPSVREQRQPAAAQPQVPPAAARGEAKVAPAAGAGNYTIQVSSWASKRKADAEASKLAVAGFDAYVVDVDIEGRTWYRVRIGRYARQSEARAVIDQLGSVVEGQPWVARFGQ